MIETVALIEQEFAAGFLGAASLIARTAAYSPAAVEAEVDDLFEAIADAIDDAAHMQPTTAEVLDLLATARAFAL